MRFKTRFDRWLVMVLILTALITCVWLPLFGHTTPGRHPPAQWITFLPLIVWLIVLPCTLPQYYEVRDSGLFLRQGWRRTLIPYSSLVELQPMSRSTSAGVFSTDRILVVVKEGKRFLIAVAEEERFLKEVSTRCPQLERKSFGLGLPFAPLSTV